MLTVFARSAFFSSLHSCVGVYSVARKSHDKDKEV